MIDVLKWQSNRLMPTDNKQLMIKRDLVEKANRLTNHQLEGTEAQEHQKVNYDSVNMSVES